ncbi:MAG: hypothetical protein ABUL43_02405, partial [Hyphomicrobium sp.]
YTPEVSFQPDDCSGIFKIGISSSKDPQRVEKRIFEVIDRMKSDVDSKEIDRLRNRIELRRRKEGKENQALVDCMVERTLFGISVVDLAVETVTREEMIAAARKYMPSHRQAYVRLALRGT